jgi:DNA-binding protein WhiA
VDVTWEAKSELSRLTISAPDLRKAELSALLRYADGLHVTGNRLVLDAEFDLEVVALRVRRAVTELYGYRAVARSVAATSAHKARRYVVQVDSNADRLARQVGLLDQRGQPVRGMPAHLIAGSDAVIESGWRGAFLARGALIEDGRTAALSVTCPGIEAALALVGTARRLGVRARTNEVRGQHRVVVRDTVDIGELLARMGAPKTRQTWEHHGRQNPRRRTPPRLADANQRRLENAAAATVAHVERALDILGDTVPAHLAQAGRLRIEHPLLSLEQLARLTDPPLSKDAMAGRLRRLIALADHARPAASADVAVQHASAPRPRDR